MQGKDRELAQAQQQLKQLVGWELMNYWMGSDVYVIATALAHAGCV